MLSKGKNRILVVILFCVFAGIATFHLTTRNTRSHVIFSLPVWTQSHSSDIERITLGPVFERHTAKIQTVTNSIAVTNATTIHDLWSTMRGEHSRQEFLPPLKHWLRDRQVTLTYHFADSGCVAFLVSLHAEHPVAAYNSLVDSTSEYSSARIMGGDKASAELYNIITNLVAAEGGWTSARHW